MSAARIKKGDTVVVLSGKDKGRTGDVSQVDAEGRQGRRRGHQRPRAPPQARPGEPAGRHRAQGGAAARLRRSRLPSTDGKPTRVRFEERGRQEGPRRCEDRGDHLMADAKYIPRLEEALRTTTHRQGDDREVRLQERSWKCPGSKRSCSTWAWARRRRTRRRSSRPPQEMEQIAGQKPVITKAKKSIAKFKLREGMPIGCKVTLRRERMYEFLDRLVTIAMPRVRDFRGLNPKSFDGRGNYAIGPQGTDRSSPRSAMTASTRSAAWTSSSPPPRRRTRKRANCSRLFGFPFPRRRLNEAGRVSGA